MNIDTSLLAIANDKLDREAPLTSDDLTKSFKDVGIDSLDLMLLLVAVQEDFEVTIPDELVPDMKSLADVVKFLEKPSS